MGRIIKFPETEGFKKGEVFILLARKIQEGNDNPSSLGYTGEKPLWKAAQILIEINAPESLILDMVKKALREIE